MSAYLPDGKLTITFPFESPPNDTLSPNCFLSIADASSGSSTSSTPNLHQSTQFDFGNKQAVKPYTEAAILAHNLGLGINAGHDLSLDNIKFFKENIPNLAEVSIGHALIAESLYLGLENVVNMYLHRLQ